ncbi:MAG: cyclic nucleotide-binding domain-containing protein, partial [Bacteroidetes bacterium]|nr:cyclic nucleotide-binding domain-containing protein [Bacteroidota bacterium]
IQYRDLPPDIQKRVLDYYTYMWKKRIGYDETSFLDTLPGNLRNEVAIHLKKEFIEDIPLFKEASDDFIGDIALKLNIMVATPGEYIFKAGDPGYDMYFVIRGELNVIEPKEDKVIFVMKDGDFFGEVALFHNQPRNASVKA